MTIRILLQTTIVPTHDDWSIARFELLANFLRRQKDAFGKPLFEVTARDREPPEAPDPILATLHRSDFDEMWLFAVDTGAGEEPEDEGPDHVDRQRACRGTRPPAAAQPVVDEVAHRSADRCASGTEASRCTTPTVHRP